MDLAKIPPNKPHSLLSLLHPSARMLHLSPALINRMLLDESPLIVHCSLREWIGFLFHPHSLPTRWLKSCFCHRSLFFSLNSRNHSQAVNSIDIKIVSQQIL